MCEGWSLIHISTLETPRRVMLPSASTSTPGAFCRASLAVPVCMLASSLVLYMFFSPSITYSGFSAVISTASSVVPRLIFSTRPSTSPLTRTLFNIGK